MLRRMLLIVAMSALVGLTDVTVPTTDRKGSKDSPLLKRYEGSIILAYDTKAFDALSLPTSALVLVPDATDRMNNRRYARSTWICRSGVPPPSWPRSRRATASPRIGCRQSASPSRAPWLPTRPKRGARRTAASSWWIRPRRRRERRTDDLSVTVRSPAGRRGGVGGGP